MSVAYVTPTYSLAKTFFDDILRYLPSASYSANKADLEIKMPTGGKIKFVSGESLDSFRGLKFHVVVIDEASYIPGLESGWLNAIRPTLTDYQGKCYFLSTPKGKNYFYSLYLKGVNRESGWASFKFTTYENPAIQPSEVDDAKSMLPGPVFEQEYMANPMENAANPFGSSHIRQCIFPISTQPPAVFGIDLAKSVDWTVIIGLDANGNVCYLDRFQKDWHGTRQAIELLPNVPMLVDSTGVGDPITEQLQQVKPDVTGYKFGVWNKQQLMLGLASAIQQRKITFPDGVIVQELDVFEYTYSPIGVKYSAPSGYHDDCVMALALAWKHFSEYRGSGQYSFL